MQYLDNRVIDKPAARAALGIEGYGQVYVDIQTMDLTKAMVDGTIDCVKIVSLDGKLLQMNKAGCRALGVPEDSDFGMLWLPLLPPSVHEVGQEALDQAVAGVCTSFPGQSQSAEGTRYWDNLLTPIIDAAGEVRAILCVSRDVTARTLLERDLNSLILREQLLRREMQHRIKNVFAVVQGLIFVAEKEAAGGAATESEAETATDILRRKVEALALASDVTIAAGTKSNLLGDEVDVGTLVSSVLRPYGSRCRMAGSRASLSHTAVTAVALLLHEFATNAVKYGSLGVDGGSVSVSWNVSREGLDLTWAEYGRQPAKSQNRPQQGGFGSEMVERLVQSVSGTLEKAWSDDGLIAELRLPASSLG